jgi:tetratricopeptide (TPR) repeat protein
MRQPRSRPARPETTVAPARHHRSAGGGAALRELLLAAGLVASVLLGSGLLATQARAQPLAPAGAAASAPQAEPTEPQPPANSAMDDRLFYQLLVAEMALTQGDLGTAYTWLLDAARRTRDDALFRRSVDVAVQARAAEQALAAARAWRLARPESLEALRLQVQLLAGTGRGEQAVEPLRSLLEATPAAERGGLISALPRLLQRSGEAAATAQRLEQLLAPYRNAAGTRVAVRVALGRAWLEAKDTERALALAREAQSLDLDAPGPALLAMELMREQPQAESLVRLHLARPAAENALRMAYVRLLTGQQRYGDAVALLEQAVKARPDDPAPWLTLGALQLELKRPAEGEAALKRFVEIQQAAPDGADPDSLVRAWLMLAQAAEQRGDIAGAEAWLARVGPEGPALDVQTRRAALLARQGRVDEARELIRVLPENNDEEARAKLAAEAGVLRGVKQWALAHEVLSRAVQRFADDTELLYELAMMAEKLQRHDEMERLLRRVIALKPDDAHSHNALGYALADRGVRLPEAKALIERALELAPGDPFIIDSLGWVEYRLGQREQALKLLRQAYAARPDTEIGAHLGEVLWSLGQRDEARQVWRESRGRDGANEVLRETLARLRVEL